MKNLFLIVIIGLICTGCMGTKEYYQAQTEYYKAQAQAQTAYLQAQNQRQPLAEMIAPDGTRFVVNQSGIIQTPVIQTTKNPIVEGMKTIVNSTPVGILAGGWAAKEIIKHSTGDVSASGQSNVTTTANSNNMTELNSAESDIVNDSSANDSRSNYDNATAAPVVVNQPDPVVVDPVVVEQPEPVMFPASGE